jgi:phage protein D
MRFALGDPLLSPQSPVRASGWKAGIDSIQWLAVKVCHTLGADGGLVSRIEMETAGLGAQSDSP